MLGTTADEPAHPNQRRTRSERMRPGVIPSPRGRTTARTVGEPLDPRDRCIMAGCQSQRAVGRCVEVARSTLDAPRSVRARVPPPIHARSATATLDRDAAVWTTGSRGPPRISVIGPSMPTTPPRWTGPRRSSRGRIRVLHRSHANASANMMVWSRPGPTEAMTTGIPAAALIWSR